MSITRIKKEQVEKARKAHENALKKDPDYKAQFDEMEKEMKKASKQKGEEIK